MNVGLKKSIEDSIDVGRSLNSELFHIVDKAKHYDAIIHNDSIYLLIKALLIFFIVVLKNSYYLYHYLFKPY